MEYKTKYFNTYGVNQKDFLYEIGQITGVNVPEPSTYAMILGLLALVAAFKRTCSFLQNKLDFTVNFGTLKPINY